MILGLTTAMLTACCYGSASILQAVAVRTLAAPVGHSVHQQRMRIGAWYATGLVLDAIGFLASLAALQRLPLFVVQAAVAASVGVTALLASAFLASRLTRAQTAALFAVGAGLVALGFGARAGPSVGVPLLGEWLLLCGVGPLGLLTLRGVTHREDSWAFVSLSLTAGLGFAGVGISARVLVLPDVWWHIAGEPVLWALLTYGALAAVCYGFALSCGSVTVATALTLVVETVVPAVVGVLVLGDRVRAGLGPVVLGGFMLVLGGCLVLAQKAQPS